MDAGSLAIDLDDHARACIRHALMTYVRAGHGDPMRRSDWLHAIACGSLRVADEMPFEQFSMDADAVQALSERLAATKIPRPLELAQDEINTILAALWHTSGVDETDFTSFLAGVTNAGLNQSAMFIRLADAAGMTEPLTNEHTRIHSKRTPAP